MSLNDQIKALKLKFFLKVMLWSGAKVFPVVSIFTPEKGDKVTVIHFAENETELYHSAHDLTAEQD